MSDAEHPEDEQRPDGEAAAEEVPAETAEEPAAQAPEPEAAEEPVAEAPEPAPEAAACDRRRACAPTAGARLAEA